VPAVILSLDDEIELADVARTLRRYADEREAHLDATWERMEEPQGAIYVRIRSAADYHERQAARRRQLNGAP
jgi:hypothetical protein